MTRTLKITLAMLAALLLAFSACDKEEGPTEPPATSQPVTEAPTTEPASTGPATDAPLEAEGAVEFSRHEDDYALNGADGAELIRVDVARPVIEALPGVNDYYADWASDVEYSISLRLQDTQEQYDDLKSIGRDFYPHSYGADFEVVRNDGVLFSVMRTYTEETGGAHGGTYYMAENFITQSGALLTMDDLFAVPQGEYYERIKEAVLEKIDELYGDGAGDVLFEGYEERLMEVYDPKHFCVTDESVIFFWQEYELGPYTAGAQLYEIPFARLADVLNAAWIK